MDCCQGARCPELRGRSPEGPVFYVVQPTASLGVAIVVRAVHPMNMRGFCSARKKWVWEKDPAQLFPWGVERGSERERMMGSDLINRPPVNETSVT